MAPKSLLRSAFSVSNMEEFTNGSFRLVVEQPNLGEKTEEVERIVLCSGKISGDLTDRIQKSDKSLDWLHVLRLEQIYPFPRRVVADLFAKYPNLKEIAWMQEEPENMGAWNYVESKLREVAPEGVSVDYIGRRRRSSPAEGDPTTHRQEQERILQEALTKTQIANDVVTR